MRPTTFNSFYALASTIRLLLQPSHAFSVVLHPYALRGIGAFGWSGYWLYYEGLRLGAIFVKDAASMKSIIDYYTNSLPLGIRCGGMDT